MKRSDRTFLSKLPGGRSTCGEIKNENVQPPQKLPYHRVIVSGFSLAKMCSESIHEVAHALLRRTRPIDAIDESTSVAQLASPRQDILVGSVDLVGRS